MIKIFRTSEIKQIDQYTIENEPILSVDLMERASLAFFRSAKKIIAEKSAVVVFAGTGNNGGDAFFIAGHLIEAGFDVCVYFCRSKTSSTSDDCRKASELFRQSYRDKYNEIGEESDLPDLSSARYVIDGLFGSGLNRPLAGFYASLIRHINQSGKSVIAIDMPSGLMGEDNGDNIEEHIIRAEHTLTFQFPKLSFLFPENEKFVGQWEVLDIHLHAEAIKNTATNYYMVDDEFIRQHVKKRDKFSHKGTYGHALLVGGSYGKMGAAVLASRACMRSGAGLLTTHVPECGYEIMQIAVPEAMVSTDKNKHVFSNNLDIEAYRNVGIGIGLGKAPETVEAMTKLLKKTTSPMVLDADALNIISENKFLLSMIPPGSILTPHPKEFERLTISLKNSYEKLKTIAIFAAQHNVYILLKGAYTIVACPDGSCYFNNSGNPGMATAGSGDVLCGIILGLLAQQYTPFEAAVLGAYFHGEAGDAAAKKHSMAGMIASDIIEELRITE